MSILLSAADQNFLAQSRLANTVLFSNAIFMLIMWVAGLVYFAIDLAIQLVPSLRSADAHYRNTIMLVPAFMTIVLVLPAVRSTSWRVALTTVLMSVLSTVLALIAAVIDTQRLSLSTIIAYEWALVVYMVVLTVASVNFIRALNKVLLHNALYHAKQERRSKKHSVLVDDAGYFDRYRAARRALEDSQQLPRAVFAVGAVIFACVFIAQMAFCRGDDNSFSNTILLVPVFWAMVFVLLVAETWSRAIWWTSSTTALIGIFFALFVAFSDSLRLGVSAASVYAWVLVVYSLVLFASALLFRAPLERFLHESTNFVRRAPLPFPLQAPDN